FFLSFFTFGIESEFLATRPRVRVASGALEARVAARVDGMSTFCLPDKSACGSEKSDCLTSSLGDLSSSAFLFLLRAGEDEEDDGPSSTSSSSSSALLLQAATPGDSEDCSPGW
ncbi:hypothetical protein PENTCL1PPCAC_358, partial [Pristionchus entomophagus]